MIALVDGNPSTASAELVARARGGDHTALTALWELHRRWVAVVLLAHKPAEVELEDLMQDVAMTLITRIGDLRDEAGFRAWLRVVAVNAARAAARSAKIRRMSRLPDGDDHGHEEPADQFPLHGQAQPLGGAATPQTSPAQEDARLLIELSRQLPFEYREPLLLKSLQEMTYRQIGALLELPETTVETRITRGRRMLRELAAGHRSDTAPSSVATTEMIARLPRPA